MDRVDPTPKCPLCKSNRRVHPEGSRAFFCLSCRVGFDNDPDEGGDYATGDPSRRLTREEGRRGHR